MLSLLASFSISLSCYLFIYTTRQIYGLFQEIKSIDPSKPNAQCWLEALNLQCNQWTWMPVFIRVYLIGIFETIYIVVCKRGLFKGSTTQQSNENQIDALIQSYTRKERTELAVITGGDSGIGLEISKGLLLAGYHLIIGTRSIKEYQNTITMLQNSTGSDKVSCIELDLSSFRSVNKFVEKVKSKVPGKDIQLLINNAGIMNVPYKMTKDNYESQCQINYLSPILLTQSLLPWINKNTGRVLFASSSTLYAINNLDTTFPYKKYKLDGLSHYAYSKAYLSQFIPQLAKTTPVKIFAYHPGTVRTKLFKHTTLFNLPFLSKIFDFIMLTAKEGSQTPLYLCLTENLEGTGTYWANTHIQKVPSVAVDGSKDNIKKLWSDIMLKCNLKVQ
ncbi:uncharacterized protein BX663DRAFT_523864 [Cokeromyces recurvatus]|uniref:uncharacterized protein n=1 Tax=Cokeromyces recurvatus TaxID=90255 RepID=UPI00221FD3D6|nr:uncharacterized protein BX663DRAFT_523864 [Cokeromyces recurvatus]KAI7898717.1 hypothetical protein BX663DRAFT_523864 [Cokeromyces recurvatus]